MFLIAKRLRNLGQFNFSDVAGFRFATVPVRIFAACGTLVVIAFYLIVQMVGAGQLIKLLFDLDYLYAVILVGFLMMIYVLFDSTTATTWVQIIKACLAAVRRDIYGVMILWYFGFSPEALFRAAVNIKTQKRGFNGGGGKNRSQAIMTPGGFIKDPCLGCFLRHGIDVWHCRSAAYSSAFFHGSGCKGGAQVCPVGG